MANRFARLLLSLANGLSVVRLLAVPLVVVLIWRAAESDSARIAALWTLIALQASDIVDGYLGRQGSRQLAIRNHFGEMIDPIADKLYIGAAYLTLALSGQFSEWFAGLVIFRDAAILSIWWLLFKRLGIRILPNLPGKLADSAEAILLLLIMLRPGESILRVLTAVTATLIVISGISYARVAMKARAGASSSV